MAKHPYGSIDISSIVSVNFLPKYVFFRSTAEEDLFVIFLNPNNITSENIVKNRTEMGKPVEKEAIEYGRDIIRKLSSFMTCSPVITMVIEGNQAQAVVKRLVGSTEPSTADTGSIRGDYALDSYYLCDTDDSRAMRNIIHCTDPADGEGAAEREISVWFKEEEIIKWNSINEKMLYDVNLDGHLG